jgi:hypothetical protein
MFALVLLLTFSFQLRRFLDFAVTGATQCSGGAPCSYTRIPFNTHTEAGLAIELLGDCIKRECYEHRRFGSNPDLQQVHVIAVHTVSGAAVSIRREAAVFVRVLSPFFFDCAFGEMC